MTTLQETITQRMATVISDHGTTPQIKREIMEAIESFSAALDLGAPLEEKLVEAASRACEEHANNAGICQGFALKIVGGWLSQPVEENVYFDKNGEEKSSFSLRQIVLPEYGDPQEHQFQVTSSQMRKSLSEKRLDDFLILSGNVYTTSRGDFVNDRAYLNAKPGTMVLPSLSVARPYTKEELLEQEKAFESQRAGVAELKLSDAHAELAALRAELEAKNAKPSKPSKSKKKAVTPK